MYEKILLRVAFVHFCAAVTAKIKMKIMKLLIVARDRQQFKEQDGESLDDKMRTLKRDGVLRKFTFLSSQFH